MDSIFVPDSCIPRVGLGLNGFDFAQVVLDAAPVLILVLDPQGRILHYNPFMERVCGRSIVEVRGLDWCTEFMIEDERELLDVCFGELPGPHERITYIRGCKGEPRLIDWHSRMLRGDGGQLECIVAVGVDITEHVREARERLELVERFEQFAERVDEIFFMIDLDRRRVLYLSPAFERITKIPRGPIYADADRLLRLFHPDQRKYLLGEAPCEGEPVERECPVLLPGEAPRWLRLRCSEVRRHPGESRRLVGVMTDITERKLAAEQLEQLGRIFTCFDAAIDQVFALVSPRREKVLYVSQSIERMLDIPRSAVLKDPRAMLERVHPDDYERISALVGQPIDDSLTLEYRVIRAKGEVRWLMSRGRVLGPESSMPGAFATVLVDITERRESELALRRLTEELESRVLERTRSLELERRRLQQVIDGMAVYVAILDAEGRVLQVNTKGTTRLSNDYVGRHAVDLPGLRYTPTSIAEIELALAEVRTGNPVRLDLESTQASGEVMITDATLSPIFDDAGQVREIVVTSVDVTERRATERRLRESFVELERKEARLADAQRIAEIGDWEWDIASDILRGSNTLQAIHGVPRGTPLTAASFLALLHPDDRAKAKASVQRAIATGEPFEVEYRFVRGDQGEPRHLLGNGEVLCDETGRPTRVRGTAQDITRRKQIEAQLRASLAEKDALLYEVHHRVKNNLQVVASILYLEGIDAGPETRQVLDECSTRIRSMSLVHEQLYVSGRFARIDMCEFLGRLAKELAHVFLVDRSIRVSIHGPGLLLDIERAVPVALLTNELLTNALKYAYPNLGPGQTAEVRVYVGPDMLEIADDGVGLATGVDLAQGSSLGLRLVHLLARQLDARLEFGAGPGCCVRLIWAG